MKAFVDTNVFVYAYNNADQRRQRIARDLLAQLEKTGEGVISVQVQQEFFWTATRKLRMDPLTAKGILQSWSRFETITPSQAILFDAIDCSITSQISFWDSLVVAAAASARCAILYSEDMNDQQLLRGLRIVNPFA